MEPADTPAALRLQPLTAAHDEAQHKLYSDELVDLLQDDDRRATVWNIALTGNYGSGKSSILAGVREQLDEKRRRVVQISLSSLNDVGVEAANTSDDPLAPKGLTNYIQKEIVKQLLYQVRPSRVSGSRFRRLSAPSKARAFSGALIGGIALVGLIWLSGWGAPFELPPESAWLRLWLLVAVGALSTALLFFAQLLLANRWRFDKIGTSSASISLTANDKSDTYFDEYLDEIVYFFEKTGRDVVIIEDLDRFEDPSIYASLRELNTLLNASEQLKKRPIHFIYAVRDSIFEDLEDKRNERSGGARPAVSPEEHHGVWQAERRLAEPATQRTKFFELVVPIVPFITHRSATDLLSQLVEKVDPEVSFDAIRVVAKHVTDMRLLRNIVNEYRVFKTRVLGPEAPKGLSEDKLFALIAYKNTHLDDFEKIRVSDSNLDRIYRRSRVVISTALNGLADELDSLESTQAPDVATVERATLLGTHLQGLSERWLRNAGRQPSQVRYRVAGNFLANDAVLEIDFWKQVIDDGHLIEVHDANESVFTLSAAALREELGAIVPASWSGSARRDGRDAIAGTRAAQRWLRAADIGDLIHPTVTLPQVDDVDYEPWVRGVVEHDPLVLDLIGSKLLDRNYPLYASQFYGVTASANAVTYDFQHVQREEPDFDFVLTPKEVKSVLSLGGSRVFESIGLFNRTIYDALLPSATELDVNLKLLATESSEALAFLKAYVQQGKRPADLARRLAPFWPGIFEFAGRELGDHAERLREFVIAAFLGADSETDYPLPQVAREIIASSGSSIEPFTELTPQIDDRVAVLGRLGVLMASFDGLPEGTIALFVAARVYQVNEATVEAVAAGDDFGLDAFLAREDDTFDHLMHHFDDYLGVLDANSRSSVTDSANIVETLSAVERFVPGRSPEIEARIHAGLIVDDVENASAEVLGVLAAGRRFRPTLHNLVTYVSTRAVDEQLISYLEEERGLEIADDALVDQRIALVTQILDAKDLSVSARVDHARQLVQEVTLTRSISAEPDLVVALLKAGLLADDPTTFQGLSRSVDSQEAFLVASSNSSEIIMRVGITEDLVARILRNEDATDELKKFIADNLPTNGAWQGTEAYEAVAEWLRQTPQPLYVETARLMAESSASVPTRALALTHYAARAGFDVTAQLTRSLGEPYSQLVARSHTPVGIPSEPDFTMVLEVLRDGESGPVSSWDPKDSAPEKVYLRHPTE